MNKIIFTKYTTVGDFSYYTNLVSPDNVAMCHPGLLRAFCVVPNTIEIRRKNPKKKGWIKLGVRRNFYDSCRFLFKYDDENYTWVCFHSRSFEFFEGITNQYGNFVWVRGK